MTKSVEEQAADDLDKRASGKFLVQSEKDGKVLGVDRRQNESGIRSVQFQEGTENSIKNSVRTSEGTDSEGNDGMPHLRQPSMREPGSSLVGDWQSEHHGCGGQAQAKKLEENDVSAGPPVPRGELIHEGGRISTVSDLPKGEGGSVQVQTRSAIKAEDNGVLQGSTFEEQYRLAKAYCASGLMPKSLGTPEKVLVALQICRELSLPAMTSIGKIMVLSGTPSLFGEMPLALVRRSGLMQLFKEEFLKGVDGEVTGVRCTTQRKGDPDPIVREFTIADAKLAKLWGKPGPWCQYPTRMLQLRARGWNLKDGYPDVLMGCGVAEFDEHVPDEDNKAATLVERFK